MSPAPSLRRRLLPAACAALLPLAAMAELSNEPLLGLGLRSRAAYDGSPDRHTEAVPVLRALGAPWFARSTQGVLEGGVRVELLPGLHVGAQLAYEPGRASAESGLLSGRGVADITRGASAGLQLELDHAVGPVPLTLLLRTRRHSGSTLGSQADLRLSVGVLRSGPLGAGLFTQATWADTKATAAHYGIDAPTAAATGLPRYAPGSGWLHASFGLLWSVDLGPRWIVVGNLEARRLRGDAAGSPLAEQRGSRSASVGMAYRY